MEPIIPPSALQQFVTMFTDIVVANSIAIIGVLVFALVALFVVKWFQRTTYKVTHLDGGGTMTEVRNRRY